MVTILKESLDEIIAELPAAHKTLLFGYYAGNHKAIIQNYLNKM
jgi:ATP-dependent RNA helicase DeaD